MKHGYPEKIKAIDGEITQLIEFIKRNINGKNSKVAVDSHEFDQIERLQKLKVRVMDWLIH